MTADLSLRVLLAALLAQAPAAQTGSGPEAISRMLRLPATARELNKGAQLLQYGPYRLSGSCDGTAWEFQTDFGTTRLQLDKYFRRLETLAAAFPERLQPVKHWLLETLPALRAEFASTRARILEYEPYVTNPRHSERVRESYRRGIVSALGDLQLRIAQATRELRDATADLAGYNRELAGHVGSLAAARDTMERRFGDDEKRILAAAIACGPEPARQQYDSIRTVMRGQFRHLEKRVEAFAVTPTQTDEALSVLMGRVLQLQNRCAAIAAELRASRLAPSAAVRELDLEVAAAEWRELEDYARREFAPEP